VVEYVLSIHKALNLILSSERKKREGTAGRRREEENKKDGRKEDKRKEGRKDRTTIVLCWVIQASIWKAI
jgi:hypothetical protein